MGYDMLARIGADISEFARKMAVVQGTLGEFGKFKGGLIGAGTLMAPSVIPMIAALAVGAGALGSAFGAAGIAAVGFGAVAVTTLGGVFEATKKAEEAQKKLTEATTAKEREAALKELEAAMAGLTDKQKEGVKALQEFKSFWSDFAKQFESPVIDMFVGSLQLLKGVLVQMAPAIGGAANGINYLIGLANQGLHSESMQQFFNFLENNAESAIISLGIIFGDVMTGIMNLMVAFGPASMGMLDGLMNLTDGFADWSETVGESEGFKKFVEYAAANGPEILSIIGAVVSILADLGIAFAPVGSAALSVINAIAEFTARLLHANPAIGSVIAAITVAVGAFMAFNPAILGVIGVVGKIGDLMQKAGDKTTLFGRAITFLTGPVGIAIGVILALIGIFTYLFNTNQQFHDQVMAIWTEIQAMFVSVLPSIMSLVQVLASLFGQIASTIFPMLAAAVQSLLPVFQTVFIAVLQIVMAVLPVIISLIQTLIPIIMQIAMAVIPLLLQAVQMVFPLVLQVVQAVMPIIIQIIQMLIPIITQIAQQILPLILQVAQQVFPMVLQLVQACIPIVQAIIAALCAFIQGIVIPAIQSVLNIVQEVFPAVQNVIQSAIDVIMGIIDFFVSALTGDWEGAWAAVEQITSSATELVNSIVDAAMEALISIVEEILADLGAPFETSWEEVKTYLSGIDLSSIGADIIQGLIDGITSMAGGVLEAIKGIGTGIQETISALMKINSPSKWMRDVIGGGIGEGLISGINGISGDVMGTVAAMTKQIQQGWSNGLGSIQLGYTAQSSIPNLNVPVSYSQEAIPNLNLGIATEMDSLRQFINGVSSAVNAMLPQNLSAVQVSPVTAGAPVPASYSLPNVRRAAQTQESANNSRPVVIENIIQYDSYEVARSTSGHIDIMQGNKVSTKNYLRGRKVERNR